MLAEGRGQRAEEGKRVGVVDACWQVLIPLAVLSLCVKPPIYTLLTWYLWLAKAVGGKRTR